MGISQRIASYMGDALNLDSDNREVVAYSLELIFHTSVTLLLVLLIAWLIGPLREAVILIIVMFLFKNFAGGAHCSSATRCTILSMLLIPSFAELSFIAGQYFTLYVLIILTVLSVLFSYTIVYKLAPVNLPIVSERHIQNRRYFSFLLLVLITIAQVILIILISDRTASFIIAIDISIFWQSFMLTKPGHALVGYYDRLLLYFTDKGGDKNETY
ncbi:putative accessory gene regulator protein [Pelotomaculum schinkii]|uniref:Putative accessory gene regulator protein n=1 Tax=Pelotomaculum schinkii TaxID=78350 RepID=A0A4Y7RAK5_9FIRM|nr:MULTISPECIES: accessory gene regulator B family protein [Pelotomaculum]TEB05759.1 putative accessory gene regulator protein [Pelotomaculum schinkii]TEB17929.1 putative accessory gene regulator protein [Pelotomaculum sp. FP]